MATRRTGWAQKSKDYRARLVSAGRTGTLTGTPGLSESEVRAYWERGGDLRAGRGHKFESPSTKAPEPSKPKPKETAKQKTARLQRDRRAEENWRKKTAPAWIPKDLADMDNETARILSTISPGPDRWRSVELVYLTDGTVVMTVTPKQGYAFKLVLPDSDSARQVAQMVSGFNYPGLKFSKEYKAPEELTPPKKVTGPSPKAKKSTKKASKKKPAKKTKKVTSKKKAATKKATKRATPKKTSKKTTKRATKKQTQRPPLLEGVGELLASIEDLQL